MRGTVISFSNEAGYGFIKPEDGSADKFCHHTSINMRGFRTLTKGQIVEFDVEISERNNKPQAVDVRPTGESNGNGSNHHPGK